MQVPKLCQSDSWLAGTGQQKVLDLVGIDCSDLDAHFLVV
jgi:hypothetical protein